MNQHKPWSKKDLEKLREIYPLGTWVELHAALPYRTEIAIRHAANKNGIKRSIPKPHITLKKMRILTVKRKRMAIGLEQFSKIMGWSPKIIRKIEGGERLPDKFQLQCYRDTIDRLEAQG